MKKNWLKLLLLILMTEAVGLLSSFFAGDIRGKYEAFEKIPLSPPGSLFGIVWPLLYLMMAVSFYLALTNATKSAKSQNVIALYGIQLALNFAWSIIFFRGDLMLFAIVIILLMLGIVAYQIWYYHQIDPWAGYLLIPYWLWLLFATYLNIGFAFIN